MAIKEEDLYIAETNTSKRVFITRFEGYDVIEWIPGPDVEQKPTAVCVVLPADLPRVGKVELMIRMKSRRAVDEMIAALQKHRDGVWPP
jgi:hypothetical protein